jgi:hypothetical protein
MPNTIAAAEIRVIVRLSPSRRPRLRRVAEPAYPHDLLIAFWFWLLASQLPAALVSLPTPLAFFWATEYS